MMDVNPKVLHQMISSDFINLNLLVPLYAAAQPMDYHAPQLAIAQTLVILRRMPKPQTNALKRGKDFAIKTSF